MLLSLCKQACLTLTVGEKRKLFLNSEQILLVLQRLDTSIFFTSVLHSFVVFLNYLLTMLKQVNFPPAASLSSAPKL